MCDLRKKQAGRLRALPLFIAGALLSASCRGQQARGGLEYPSPPAPAESLAAVDGGLPETPGELSGVSYFVYRVQSGDMILALANKFGVDQDTLISVNNIKNTRRILPGEYLKIPSEAGVIYTVRESGETIEGIARKYGADGERCADIARVSLTEPLKAGAPVFVPGGKLDSTQLAEINGDLFRRPLAKFSRWSDAYGYRWSPFVKGLRSFHTGVDMVGPPGTAIIAAMDGRVIEAGWSDTYGNYVKIQHHSGYVTLYGHMSRLNTSRGQWVAAGQRIGIIGTTGLSTGIHLHFTVWKNGRLVNPRMLMK